MPFYFPYIKQCIGEINVTLAENFGYLLIHDEEFVSIWRQTAALVTQPWSFYDNTLPNPGLEPGAFPSLGKSAVPIWKKKGMEKVRTRTVENPKYKWCLSEDIHHRSICVLSPEHHHLLT